VHEGRGTVDVSRRDRQVAVLDSRIERTSWAVVKSRQSLPLMTFASRSASNARCAAEAWESAEGLGSPASCQPAIASSPV
jgi:hypothetical protein